MSDWRSLIRINRLVFALSFVIFVAVALLLPEDGPLAILLCALLGLAAYAALRRSTQDTEFLLIVFVFALLMRVVLGTFIYALDLQEFFGADVFTYDYLGEITLRYWRGAEIYKADIDFFSQGGGWGMLYLVAAVYSVTGRNMLAIQYLNAVVGAATAPLIYLCARYMFENVRVARVAMLLVAFFPSLVLWSSQGLKDGPIIFLLALAMLATLRLGERFSVGNIVVLVVALVGVFSLRFYVFYMLAAAVGGALVIGTRSASAQGMFRQFVAFVCVGLGLTYFGVLRTASFQLEEFADLDRIQRSRIDLARSAESGFGRDVDVSTTEGALTVIPVGMMYILFAPFPWQMANLRQSITLPEMLVWWASFPLLVLGLWYALRHRLRRALPVLMFTSMLTLAYSLFQGNVGTAYRQRAQLLIFYFIFVAVGWGLLRERREDRLAAARAASLAARTAKGVVT